MCRAYILITTVICIFNIVVAENPSYDQGIYKPDFLNYCYEDKEECQDVCGCMLERKCMVRPIPPTVMELIVDRHNNARKERLKGDPRASGMARLEYDAQLEAIAQCWAAKCRENTTDCLLTESYAEVGMNMGTIKTEEVNPTPFLESPYSDTRPIEELWKIVIDEWTKELDSIQFSQEFTGASETKRGAQMVHDQTLAVGCAWSGSPDGLYFYCAYGPSIKEGLHVYKSGQQCTTCPPGLKCTDDSEGLCIRYSLYPSPIVTKPPPSARPAQPTKRPPRAPSTKGGANLIVSSLGLILPASMVTLLTWQ